ncbi:hypothetical protein SCLCIDRAFT_18529 [Scleroderma citrinum Foug A]|uniref:Mitochondrial inner membrane protease ATP23 n=1 Tax=Scleroderma citrinum Foug A TaxID=1036808 RepID=A0A0C2YL97_9AGAM|nr:hypothetical protein SCLCIDRAFT_18529 [Scleroderma citrinum Foug A]
MRPWLRWQNIAVQVTGIRMSTEEQQRNLKQQKYARCEKWKAELLNYSPKVVSMLNHLRLSGCPIPPSSIVCAPCDPTRPSGFHPAGAIVLCQGHFGRKKHMEATLAHKLIRTNNLSGDCRYMRELGRRYVSFSKQHQACVRRRAALSVRANPACLDTASTERAVDEV